MNTEKQPSKVCGHCRSICVLDTGYNYNAAKTGDGRYLCYNDMCPLNLEKQRHTDVLETLTIAMRLIVIAAPFVLALYYFLLAT